MGNKVRAVMFDWAGTTVDFGSRAPASVFVEIFRRQGLDITVAEARGPMGMAKRDHIASILAMPRVAEAWLKVHGQAASDADIDRLYAEFLPLQKETLLNHADVIPGVPELLAELRRRDIKIGSSTGYTRELMDVLIPAARANGFDPEVVLCAGESRQGRPAPWMLFRCAELLDVFPMSNVVVVDDTAVGIEAGHNAGAWTVGVLQSGNAMGLSRQELQVLPPTELTQRTETARTSLARAHFTINSIADLIPVLDQINESNDERGTNRTMNDER